MIKIKIYDDTYVSKKRKEIINYYINKYYKKIKYYLQSSKPFKWVIN